MSKVALVVHRYGKEICGGAEYHAFLLASQLKSQYDIEILTTTAIDDSTWANYYPEGSIEEDGVVVRRFYVDQNRECGRERNLDNLIADKKHSFYEEVATLIEIGPYSKNLFNFVRNNFNSYSAIIFFTYYYYQTSIVSLGIPNAILLPTAHDEINIYLPFYKKLFSEAKGFIFNTEDEKNLVERLIGSKISSPNVIAGVGIDLPDDDAIVHLKNKKKESYILYLGRVSKGKGCDQLLNFVTKYNREHENKILLKLAGNLQLDLPSDPYIEYLGFVSEPVKHNLIANAKMLIQPSEHESLSLVVLEAMAYGCPVLVNKTCKVLESHVVKSKGGLTYHDYESFISAIETIYNSDAKFLFGSNGRDYVKKNYSWEDVVKKVSWLICEIDFKPSQESHNNIVNRTIPIILASDDKYVKYLGVALASVCEYINNDSSYEIIILSDSISSKNRKRLLKFSEKYYNLKIRFIECSEILNKYTFNFYNKQLSRATFMRFLCLDLLPELEKVLYIDCDVVVAEDIANLYSVELDDNLIGAVVDPHIEVIRSYDRTIDDHIKYLVKRTTPYFNAGVLLINLKELRASYSTHSLLDYASVSTWKWEDQDILSHISDGRTKYLDRSWNVLWVNDKYIQNIMEFNFDYLKVLSDPKIYHFAGGVMPTKCDDSPWSIEFWEVARKSPFYEDVLKEYLDRKKQIIPLLGDKKYLNRRLDKLKNSLKKRKKKVNDIIDAFYRKLKD